jgi:hypothetical protein
MWTGRLTRWARVKHRSVLGITVRDLVSQNAQLEYSACFLQADPTHQILPNRGIPDGRAAPIDREQAARPYRLE